MKYLKEMMKSKEDKTEKKEERSSPADKARMDSLKALRKMAMEMLADDAMAGLGDEKTPDMSVMVVKKKKGMLRPDMSDEEDEEMMGPESLEDYADDMTTDSEYDNGMNDGDEEDEDKLKKMLKV